jgi:hypothetical protein
MPTNGPADAFPDPSVGGSETAFDSAEGSHEYVSLLAEAIKEARREVESEIARADSESADRRKEALLLALSQLAKLDMHVKSSRRLLNDLRTMKRLLLNDKADFRLTFQPDVSPEQLKGVLTALADYFRACGGVGLRIDPEIEVIALRVLTYA